MNEEYFDDNLDAFGDSTGGKIIGGFSMEDLKYSSNDQSIEFLEDNIRAKRKTEFKYEIIDGVALYSFQYNDGRFKFYLSKEIAQAISEMLKNGKRNTPVKNWCKVDKNVDESYMLHLIKKHQQDGTIKYRQSTGEIVAVYPNGEINYGKLPYTLDELKEKLNALLNE